MHRRLSLILLLFVAPLACEKREPPPTNQPQGEPKKSDTKLLEKGSSTLQSFEPMKQIDVYLDGFHAMKDDPTLTMEAHHYCRAKNEDFMQCVIFDANTKDANLVGVEYIVSESIYDRLPDDEKQFWHPHNFEILSGQLVAPGLPDAAEKAFLEKKVNSYGKTWHIWDTGHLDQEGHDLPVGEPMLAWSYNHDGEAPQAMVDDRDRRLNVSTAKKRKERADLTPLARPQEGVDDLSPFFPHAKTAPPGVRAKVTEPPKRKR
jgi:hypothetical protein